MSEIEMEVESRDKSNGGQGTLKARMIAGPHTGPFTHINSLNIINSPARRDSPSFMDEKTEVHSSDVPHTSWGMAEPRFQRQ